MKRLIFDGSNSLFRSAYRAASRYGQKEPMWNSDTVYTFISSVRSLVSKFFPDSVFIVWDGGRSIRRRVLYPEYKQHRTENFDPDGMEKVKSEISELLLNLKCRVITLVGREADDVISFMVSKFGGNNVVVSDDSDYFDLITKGARIYRPLSQQFLSMLNFKEIYKVSPRQHLLMKSVIGDTSDNVKGVYGVGSITITEILEKNPEVSNLDELFEAARSFGGKKRRVKLVVENEEMVRRNFELLDTEKELFTEKEIKLLEDSTISGICWSSEKVSQNLGGLGLDSILQFFTEWSVPFRTLR